MKKNLKNKLIAVFVAVMMIAIQFASGSFNYVKAEGNFGVQVVVQSFDGIVVNDKSEKANALEALTDVLNKNKIKFEASDSQFGKMIISINGVKNKKFGAGDGWMYLTKNNGQYITPMASIDGTTLKNGEKLIVYYSNWGVTLLADKIDYSTTEANKEIIISLNNNFEDWSTGKSVVKVTPINNVQAKIDGKDVQVKENKITIKEGLKEGKHTLELSDWKKDACPGVVADSIEFNIGNENTVKPIETTNSDSKKEVSNVSKNIDGEIKYLADYIKSQPASEWSAVSLNKLGIKADENFINKKAEEIKKSGISDFSNTDIEALIIGLVAEGYTPYNFAGCNLVSELFNRDSKTFLINDAVFGLLTYNYANITGEYKITPEILKNIILKSKLSYKINENDIVGWAYMGEKIDPDMTGITIAALSNMYDKDIEVKSIIDKSVKSLSILQNEEGYITGNYGISSESESFVILGLTSVGINPEGEMFTKTKGNLVSALLSFKGNDGQYKHELKGNNSAFSTEQALRAMIALSEYEKGGKYNYYSSKVESKNLKVFGANETNNSELKTAAILPQTGGVLDTYVLTGIGITFVLIGIVVFRKKNVNRG